MPLELGKELATVVEVVNEVHQDIGLEEEVQTQEPIEVRAGARRWPR